VKDVIFPPTSSSRVVGDARPQAIGHRYLTLPWVVKGYLLWQGIDYAWFHCNATFGPGQRAAGAKFCRFYTVSTEPAALSYTYPWLPHLLLQ